ncbi:MAG: ARMT1-like domain-containing protein [Syntrophomonas sp.]
MKLSIECLPCLLGQAVRLAKEHIYSEEARQSLLKRVLRELADLEDDASAPYAAQKIQRLFKELLQNPDPYREEKHYYNIEMLKLENDFEELLRSANDHLSTALKLAAAGNVIDFGPGYDLSREKVLQVIRETLEKEFPVEPFEELKSRLKNAKKLLYLGDNSGEIVLDKVFIRTIKEHHPQLEVKFATRGMPVINDVTEEDAYLVGMQDYADIINNGIDIPGTVLEHCSAGFQDIFNDADVVIAKGQGNLESLLGCGKENLFYIFLCKCDLFAQRCGAKKKDIILKAE